MAFRRLALFLTALTLAGLLAIAGLVTLFSRSDPGTTVSSPAPSAWRVASGGTTNIERALASGGTFLAHDVVMLERHDATLQILPGSRCSFDTPARDGGDGNLPVIHDGRMILVTAVELNLGDIHVAPRGPVRLAVTPRRVIILGGSLLIEDLLFAVGDTFSRISDGDDEGAAPRTRESVAVDNAADAATAIRNRPDGQVVDAYDGTPIAGVHILATFSYSDDGWPPHPDSGSQVEITSDLAGRFSISTGASAFRPHDPRLILHLGTDHPAYLPLAHVVEAPPDLHGRRPPTRLALRRALTTTVRFLDPDGLPLSRVAVTLEEHRVGDPFLGEDTWEEGGTFRRDRRIIRYTSRDGLLRIGMTPTDLVLLHPLFHLREAGRSDIVALVTYPPDQPRHRWREPFEVHAGRGRARQYRVEDLDRVPAARTLVEVALDGMPSLRLHTDNDGVIEIAPWPRVGGPHSGLPVDPGHSRTGRLTCLSTLLWKRATNIRMPDPVRRITVNGRVAKRLCLRTTAETANGDVVPIPPHGIRLDRKDMTLSYQSPDGHVHFDGTLPEPGSVLTVLLRGRLPHVLRIPAYPLNATEVDLGDVRFDAGETTEVADDVSGVETTLHGRVVGVDPEQSHRYRVIERYYPDSPDSARVTTNGPITCVSYPLSPDGLVGSVRILPASGEAEIFIVGPSGLEGAHRSRRAPPDGATFDMRTLRIEPLPHAIFRFTIRGIGAVSPPEEVSLLERTSRYDEVTMLADLGSLLVVNNVMPGEYELRWGNGGPTAGVHAFRIEAGHPEHAWTIEREPASSENVVVRVEDAAGKPLTGVAVRRREDDSEPPWSRVRDAEIRTSIHGPRPMTALYGEDFLGSFVRPGYYLLPFHPGRRNIFRFDATSAGVGRDGEDRRPTRLPTVLTVPVGAQVPDPIVLADGVRVTGTVLDIDGRRIDGVLRISWLPVRDRDETLGESREARVEIFTDEPLLTPVDFGALASDEFPPGRHRVRLELENSAASAERVVDLSPAKLNRLGIIRLEETRSLSGNVILSSGEAVANAVVALVTAGSAWRLPGRDLDLENQPLVTRSDVRGRFNIDGLPLEFGDDFALVAHLDGRTDAVENPVDLTFDTHTLVLEEDTELVIRAGYRDGSLHPDFRFRLEFTHLDGASASPDDNTVELGPVDPSAAAGLAYRGITPGLYRLAWNLVTPHPVTGGRVTEVLLLPGTTATLSLRVTDVFCRGEAVFNGLPLERGWVLVTHSPGNSGSTSTARVIDGTFEVPVSLRAETAHVALIPERTPIPTPDFYRGEVLPVPYPDYRFDVRKRFLRIDYRAYSLTYELPPSIHSRHSRIAVEFPHYTWEHIAFRRALDVEDLVGNTLTLRLLPPGTVGLRFTSPEGYRHLNTIALYSDTVIRVGPE